MYDWMYCRSIDGWNNPRCSNCTFIEVNINKNKFDINMYVIPLNIIFICDSFVFLLIQRVRVRLYMVLSIIRIYLRYPIRNKRAIYKAIRSNMMVLYGLRVRRHYESGFVSINHRTSLYAARRNTIVIRSHANRCISRSRL